MFGRRKPEVLVVGAGPVGLFAALALTRRGVKVEIVDREWRAGTRSNALAVHAATLQLMEQEGVLTELLEHAYRVRTVGLYQGPERKAEMRIADLAQDHSFLAVMRQDLLERLLEDALRKAGVTVHWNHEVTALTEHDDGVTVKLDKWDRDTGGYGVEHASWTVTRSRERECQFVIGADGHASRVRRELGLEFPQVGETADFAVFEFRSDADFGDEMRLCLDEAGMTVVWPLPSGYCRWSFQLPSFDALEGSRDKDRDLVMPGAGDDRELTIERLRELIAARAPWFRGSVEAVRWSMFVRFESRLAQRFGRGRRWLAGDAAHLTGPAGVHSMNVGLREARQLAEIVAGIHAGRTGAAALEEYDRAQASEWRFLLGLDGGLEAGTGTDPAFAARRAQLLPSIPASGPDLQRLAAQVGLTAKPSPRATR